MKAFLIVVIVLAILEVFGRALFLGVCQYPRSSETRRWVDIGELVTSLALVVWEFWLI